MNDRTREMPSQSETESDNRARRKPWPVESDRPTDAADAGSVELQVPEQRIRAAFGQSVAGTLPRVSEESLHAYYEYLAQELSFPFVARCWEEVNSLESVGHVVTVDSLISPQKRRPDVTSGLFCVARTGDRTLELPLAELELGNGSANSRLVEDYWYWFWNWRPEQR